MKTCNPIPLAGLMFLYANLGMPGPMAAFAEEGPAHRTYGPWHSGRIGGGGYLQHAVFAPSDPRRVYLSSDVGGAFRSDDGGETWHMLHGSLPPRSESYSISGIVVHPANRDLVYMATDDGVWRSTDAGANWTRVLSARFLGNGWFRGDGRVLVMDPADPRVLYAAPLLDGLQVSRDGGDTWATVGPLNTYPCDLRVDVTNPRRLWLSTRGDGKRQVPVGDGRRFTPDGGLYLSEDGGANWEKIQPQGMKEIVQDPNDPGTLIALESEAGRPVVSGDLGRSWQPLETGLPPAKIEVREDGSYGALATGPDFTLLGGNGGNIYRLEKGSEAWVKVNWSKQDVREGGWWGALTQPTVRHFGSALSWIAIDPADPGHWLFTDWYACYRTNDAGRSWDLSIDGVEMTVVHTVQQDLADPRVLHVGLADVGYFRSTDAGEHFTQVNRGIGNNIKHISLCRSQPTRLYAVGPITWEWEANQVFISSDSGLNWQRSEMTGLPEMKSRRCNTVAANPAKADEVYLTLNGPVSDGQGGIWKSADAGQSWTWIGQGLPAGQPLFRTDIWISGPELAVAPSGAMVACSIDQNRLFRRSAGDPRWSEIQLPKGAGKTNAVLADTLQANRFYLCMQDGGLWRSEDAGRSWRRLLSQGAWAVAVDARDSNRLAVNGDRGLYVSWDGGRNWATLPDSLPYRHYRNVVSFVGDRLAVGTGGNGVFWINMEAASATATAVRAPQERPEEVTAGPPARPAEKGPDPQEFVRNGNFEFGEDTPEHWGLASYRVGEVKLSRNPVEYHKDPGSLLLETQGPAEAFAQQPLQRVPDGAVDVSVAIKSEGDFQLLQVAFQVFDGAGQQIEWKTIGSVEASRDWQIIEKRIELPEEAYTVYFGVSVKGNGKVWLDNVSLLGTHELPDPDDQTSIEPTPAATLGAKDLPVKVPADDPRIYYVGRFDKLSPQAPRFSWSGSSISLRFRGTSVNAVLKDSGKNRFQVIVDGVPTTMLSQLGSGGQSVPLASGLADDEHTVTIMKATEPIFGISTFQGFELSEGAVPLPPKRMAHRLEVIGDSISTGYGNEAASQSEHFSPETQNAARTYGYLAASRLDAEFVCLAWSGRKLAFDNTIPEIYNRALPQEERSEWNFSQWRPDAVLVNLGTNDFSGANPDQARWTQAYQEFLTRLRSNYPEAHIYIALGPMLSDQWSSQRNPLSTIREYLNQVVTRQRQSGDHRVHFLEFPMQDGSLGFGADWHPSLKTHEAMADILTRILRQDLQW